MNLYHIAEENPNCTSEWHNDAG